MDEREEARQLVKKIEGLGLGDATIGDMVDEIERLRNQKELMVKPTLAQIESVCLSFRHDYGLMDDKARKSLQFHAIEWHHAWLKEFKLK